MLCLHGAVDAVQGVQAGRQMTHFGLHVCNNPLQDIRHTATLSSFKSKLKTFLFSEYFS